MLKNKIVISTLLLVAVGAIAAIVHLQAQATASRDAQLRLGNLQLQLNELQDIPWQAGPAQGGRPDVVRREFGAANRRITRDLARLRGEGVAVREIDAVTRPFNETIAPLKQIIAFASRGDTASGSEAAGLAWRSATRASEALRAAARVHDARASRAQARTVYGSAAVIALLFGAFVFFLRRAARAQDVAERLAADKHDLLEAARQQAMTDALTGLGNRRALRGDLEQALESATTADPYVLAIFDLDGFKQYNDSFGHPAGDALLARLGDRLATTLDGLGRTYRVGGDEFCLLAHAGSVGSGAAVRLAAAALTEDGEGFRVGCSYGVAQLPADASDPATALRVADQRMYGQKASGRATASRQSTDVLVQVLGERSADLQHHTDDVARMAERTARRLGLGEADVLTIRLAAELHDVGKIAIPDEILAKKEHLDGDEWAFVRRHTVIGERIVLAAPSLAHTAKLIRAHHERIDGTGYPDRLRDEEIPLGARIIAVCDAYAAMTSDRPYRAARTPSDALAELQRCAGTQFDHQAVEAFTALAREDLDQRSASQPA